jgi:NAD(P)-dependent dehydrogenase (short-subunit alcohol dehydrogenase family)
MASAVIIGAGPGIGTSVARRFAAEGFDIGLVARTQATLEAASAAVGGARTALADAADDEQLIAALEVLGTPDVLVYNAGLIRPDRPGELTHAQHQAAYAINVLGALTAASHVAPAMRAGTILITGGMPRPIPSYTSLSLGKAGVRALAEILAAEYPHVHVATVLVAGDVGDTADEIADEYWRLHCQPQDEWERHVVFDPVGARQTA